MDRCAAGDSDAMREIIQRYEPTLRRLLYRFLFTADDVDDTLCEVFLRVWRSAPRYRGECSVSTWVQRVAVSAATDALRRRRTRRDLHAPMVDESVPTAASEEPERVVLGRIAEERSRELVRSAIDTLR